MGKEKMLIQGPEKYLDYRERDHEQVWEETLSIVQTLHVIPVCYDTWNGVARGMLTLDLDQH